MKARVTFSSGDDRRPLWSATGKEAIFSSHRGGDKLYRIYRKSADGTGQVQLVHSAEGMNTFASDWSPDGRYVVYDLRELAGSATDIWYLESQNDETFEARPFLARKGLAQKAGRISPDGSWLAYVSNESGQNEVYVQRFPAGGDKYRVSQDGGIQPLWSYKGDAMYFVSGDTLFRVEVHFEERIRMGYPMPIIRSIGFMGGSLSVHPQYDVSADDDRFVVRKPTSVVRSSIHLVQNWYEEFRTREQD